jgi:hypothetical protein
MYSYLLRTEIILCWVVDLFGLFACMHVCWEPSKLLCLACHVCLMRTEIIFVRVEIIVLIFTELLTLFLNCQTRQVPDNHPKHGGYGYVYEFLSVNMGICMNFYTWSFCWRADNCSTRHELNLLPSLGALASEEAKWRRDWVVVIVTKLIWSFYSSKGWELGGPGRVAYFGGADSMLLFQFKREGNGMKCC